MQRCFDLSYTFYDCITNIYNRFSILYFLGEQFGINRGTQRRRQHYFEESGMSNKHLEIIIAIPASCCISYCCSRGHFSRFPVLQGFGGHLVHF